MMRFRVDGGCLRSNFVPALTLLAFSLPFAACVAPPELIQAQNYDFGVAPTNAEAQIKEHFGRTLKDPMSAVYEVSPAWKARCNAHWALPYEPVVGWVVRANVNAKNSYGGYVGATPYFVFFGPDGTMKKVLSDNEYHAGERCVELPSG